VLAKRPARLLCVNYDAGAETFGVIARRLGQRTPHRAACVNHIMNGHTAGTLMQVIGAGTTDLGTLIMFVVDAARPFSESNT